MSIKMISIEKSRAVDPTLEPIWISGDKHHPMYSMDTKHIQNALNKYHRSGYPKSSWQNKFKKYWVEEFTNELAAREGEKTRHPETNEFYSMYELKKQRAMRRVMLGLPPVKQETVVISDATVTPERSLFDECIQN